MIITTGNPVSLTTSEHRNQTAAMLPPAKVALAVRGGIHSGLGITKTSGMGFRIAAGRAIVCPASPSAGPYTVSVLDPETMSFAPGDVSRDRIDIVAVKVDESPDNATPASIVILQGAYPVTGLPVAPAVPAAHEPLFQVPIPAGVSGGTGGWTPASATDLRRQLASIGSYIPVRSVSERDQLLAYDGLTVMRLDLGGSIDRYVDGRWRGNTDWIYCDLSPKWTPILPSNHALYNRTRLRCKVVGDGGQLAIWGELKYTGTDAVTEGMVMGKIPASSKITPEDGIWIIGTDDNYSGFILITVSKNGEIRVGPRPTGKVFMFQGVAPMDYT